MVQLRVLFFAREVLAINLVAAALFVNEDAADRTLVRVWPAEAKE